MSETGNLCRGSGVNGLVGDSRVERFWGSGLAEGIQGSVLCSRCSNQEVRVGCLRRFWV